MEFYFQSFNSNTSEMEVITSIDTDKVEGKPELIEIWLGADIYLNEYTVYRQYKYAVNENKPFYHLAEAVEASKIGNKIRFELNGEEAYIASSDFLRIFTEWINYFEFDKRISLWHYYFEDEASSLRYVQYMLDFPTDHNYTLEEIKQEMKNVDMKEIDILNVHLIREKIGDMADEIVVAIKEGENYGIKVRLEPEPPTKKK